MFVGFAGMVVPNGRRGRHGLARKLVGLDFAGGSWLSPADDGGFAMSGFLDMAKEMAETVKDKIEDHIPDSIKEKLHIGDDTDDAVEDAAADVAGDAAPTEE